MCAGSFRAGERCRANRRTCRRSPASCRCSDCASRRRAPDRSHSGRTPIAAASDRRCSWCDPAHSRACTSSSLAGCREERARRGCPSRRHDGSAQCCCHSRKTRHRCSRRRMAPSRRETTAGSVDRSPGPGWWWTSERCRICIESRASLARTPAVEVRRARATRSHRRRACDGGPEAASRQSAGCPTCSPRTRFAAVPGKGFQQARGFGRTWYRVVACKRRRWSRRASRTRPASAFPPQTSSTA